MSNDKVRDDCVAWAEVEYRNAELFTRTDLALSVSAWRAGRRAALEEAARLLEDGVEFPRWAEACDAAEVYAAAIRQLKDEK